MKTKTIITALFMMFSIASFAQTKEETISWIKEKLEKYGGYEDVYYKNISISPCKISWTEVTSGKEYLLEFNPTTAKAWTVGDNKTYIRANAKIIREVNPNGSTRNTSYIYIKNGESDIHERMIKALLHLATFCEEGKNEAF